MSEAKRRFATFKEYLRHQFKDGPFPATDAIIHYKDEKEGKEGVVLIERKNEPYGIAFPGGMAEQMEFHENAIKEAKEETGLDFTLLSPKEEPVFVFSNPRQDSRAFISASFYVGRGHGVLRPDPDEDAKS